jgi:hypothetical protein
MWNALVFYPDLKNEALIRFRQKYDPGYPGFKEHMPLLLTIPDTVSNDRLYKHLRRVLDIWSPFEIHFHGLFKSWDHWLLPGVKEGNDQVRVLHEEIYPGILKPFQRRDLPSEPHIALDLFAVKNYDPLSPTQIGLNDEKYRIALCEAKSLKFDFWCKAELLDLIQGQNGFVPHPLRFINFH